MKALTKQVERFTETDIDDEIVVMRLDSGDFFSLEGTAAATWRLIDGTRDRVAIIEALAAQFNADDVEVAADVDDFLAQLKEQKLIATA